MRNRRRTEEGFVHVMRGEQLTRQWAAGRMAAQRLQSQCKYSDAIA
jgi:hypothetical protein